MNLETQLHRLEQQLNAFEKLHTDELKKFEEKLAAYLRLQADEVKFLRQELTALKKELADRKLNDPSPSSDQKQPVLNATAEAAAQITRREFLGGGGNLHQS